MKPLSSYESFSSEPFAACENPDVPMGKWVMDRVDPRPGMLLDVGCGTGLHTKWFNAQGVEAHGITINEAEVAKKLHENVRIGDMCDIPFADGVFDCVFCL